MITTRLVLPQPSPSIDPAQTVPHLTSWASFLASVWGRQKGAREKGNGDLPAEISELLVNALESHCECVCGVVRVSKESVAVSLDCWRRGVISVGNGNREMQE